MKVGILGTGLIGTSVGLGLADAGWSVTAWDPDPESIAIAAQRGGGVEAASNEQEVLDGASDLLVLAAPPMAVVDLVGRLEHDGLTIDVAGVKEPIISASRLARFVGTHPMAGREVTGPSAATAALFHGASWVVTEDRAEPGDVTAVSEIVSSLGARPIVMRAAEHDAAVAAISHLPQVIAASLVSSASGSAVAMDLAAGSFRDLTRVAASDPALWVELLGSNRHQVTAVLASFRKHVDELEAAITSDGPELSALLEDARAVREAMTARAVTVQVALEDRPGELARVGHAFERSSADIRDIQLRHAPYGGGGVLTVTVAPGGAKALADALALEGLLVIE